jgi:cell division protein FtsQ
MMRAEMFQIAGVDVQGKHYVHDDDLNRVAALFRGQNIFQVDLEKAASRARENPWVKEVRIHRRLPNRINLVLSERHPAAILDVDDGRYLMDGAGVVILRIAREETRSWSLPIIAVRDVKVRPGEAVLSEGIAEALTLLQEIAARGGWRQHEVTIRAGAPDAMAILYANHEFKIGAGNHREKLRRLSEILSDAAERGLEITSVDLRPERQAAVMVKNSRGQGTGSGVKGKKRT